MASAFICMSLLGYSRPRLRKLPCSYTLFRLISIAKYVLSSQSIYPGGQSLKYLVSMFLTCALYYDAGPGCLIRTIYKY